MNLIVVPEAVDVHRYAADLFQSWTAENPEATAVMAVGNTPMGMYGILAERARLGSFASSALRIFQLDDYVGLAEHDPRSLKRWLRQSVVEPWGIPEKQVVTFGESGEGADVERVCRAYEQSVREAGGYDIAVLGLGPNGHLGFNEPPSEPNSPTRVIPLTPESIRSSAAYWGGEEQVPAFGMTAGLDLLLASKRILLLVTGERKRDILVQAVCGPVTPAVPASFLQRYPQAAIVADRAAWPFDKA